MAPTLAMSITGVQAAKLLGHAAPLAYLVASLGIALVAYGFVRLSSEVASAGSVYAFVTHAIGPRAGLICGWAMLGTYLVFPAVSITAIAVFGRAFLSSTGLIENAPWLPLALVGWLIVAVGASREVRTAARALLAFELVSVLAIVALMGVILWRIHSGSAPGPQALNADWLALPAGTPLSAVALAATFGFLSFAGFESAGSFGEEATQPTHRIPRALIAAVAFGAVFYTGCVAVQSLGFGTDAAGVTAFARSQAPLGDLAQAYVGSAMADVLDLAAIISAIGAGLGCAAVAGRLLFALGRDGVLPRSLGGIGGAGGVPVNGLRLVLGVDLVLLVAFGIAGAQPMNAFFYIATIGTLSLLCMYGMTNIAAALHFARSRRRVEALVAVAGLCVVGYVLFHNLWPVPESPFDVLPWIVVAWLALGTILAFRPAAGLVKSPG